MQEFLKKCSEAYYEGNPIISDDQFDNLVEQFGFNEVGAKPTGKTAKHLYRMYSLQKVYKGEDTPPFAQNSNSVTSLKFDGAAISALYADGQLVRVLTRGDGIDGQDITDKFLYEETVLPHKISIMGLLQVTGEIVAPKTIENARNYAAGALNLKSVDEFIQRDISFIAYGSYYEGMLLSSYTDDMDVLNDNGFSVAKNISITQDIYPTDGLVVRLDNNADFEYAGYTSKHPKGAYAIKTRGEAVETEILSVDWQVGKSGKVTPVANLRPVMVGDAEVSRATLNNQAFIENLGIYIGCTVGIERGGEVIPKVLYVK